MTRRPSLINLVRIPFTELEGTRERGRGEGGGKSSDLGGCLTWMSFLEPAGPKELSLAAFSDSLVSFTFRDFEVDLALSGCV